LQKIEFFPNVLLANIPGCLRIYFFVSGESEYPFFDYAWIASNDSRNFICNSAFIAHCVLYNLYNLTSKWCNDNKLCHVHCTVISGSSSYSLKFVSKFSIFLTPLSKSSYSKIWGIFVTETAYKSAVRVTEISIHFKLVSSSGPHLHFSWFLFVCLKLIRKKLLFIYL